MVWADNVVLRTCHVDDLHQIGDDKVKCPVNQQSKEPNPQDVSACTQTRPWRKVGSCCKTAVRLVRRLPQALLLQALWSLRYCNAWI